VTKSTARDKWRYSRATATPRIKGSNRSIGVVLRITLSVVIDIRLVDSFMMIDDSLDS
jgi:hypothetical protein